MKKAAVLIMSIFMASASVLGMSACEDGKKAEVQPVQDYTSYTLEGYTAPIWKQSVIGNETVMFVGKDDVTPLLFTPDEIISVRSADLKTTYEEGVDYVLQDGKIGLTENTSIPYWEEAEYYPEQEIPGRSYEKKGGGYLLYGEIAFAYSQIICVFHTACIAISINCLLAAMDIARDQWSAHCGRFQQGVCHTFMIGRKNETMALSDEYSDI